MRQTVVRSAYSLNDQAWEPRMPAIQSSRKELPHLRRLFPHRLREESVQVAFALAIFALSWASTPSVAATTASGDRSANALQCFTGVGRAKAYSTAFATQRMLIFLQSPSSFSTCSGGVKLSDSWCADGKTTLLEHKGTTKRPKHWFVVACKGKPAQQATYTVMSGAERFWVSPMENEAERK